MYSLNNLREDRYKEIVSAGLFSKQQAKQYYEDLRIELEKKYNKLKAPHLSQIASITKENEANLNQDNPLFLLSRDNSDKTNITREI